jgi:FMN phosphatase YigB (HAD superfamily)
MAARYGLTPNEVVWVEDVLSNDESSSDAELAKYFIRGGLTQEQADSVMCYRDDYLRNVYFKGEGPLQFNNGRGTC